MGSKSNPQVDSEPTARRSLGVAHWAVWSVPLAAVLVGGFWVYQALVNVGPTITIRFDDGRGLKKDQSLLRYRGVTAGTVRKVRFTPEGEAVLVDVDLNADAAFLAREGSAFWVVRPEVTRQGVSGLGTLVSGPYIASLAGTGETPKAEFVGLPERPETDYGGLDLLLIAPRIKSLSEDAEVQYRGLPVGHVRQIALSDDAADVLVKVHIDSPHTHLVREDSRFWISGGLDFRFRLFGESELEGPSLSEAFSGTVSFATPGPPGARVTSGQHFTLHDSPEDAWLEWHPALPPE